MKATDDNRRATLAPTSFSWRKVFRGVARYWPTMLVIGLTALVMSLYDLGEMLERHHRKMMENVDYVIAALFIAAVFYVIVQIVRAFWGSDQDED